MPRIPFETASPPPRAGGGERGLQLAAIPQAPLANPQSFAAPGRAMQQAGMELSNFAAQVGEVVIRAEGEDAYQRGLVEWSERQEGVRQRVTQRLTSTNPDERIERSAVPRVFADEARTELTGFLDNVSNPYARRRLAADAGRGIVVASADIRRDSLRMLAGELESGLTDLAERARTAQANGASNAGQLFEALETQLANARGIVDPVRLGNIRRGFVDGVAQDTILGAAQPNPLAAMRSITSGRFSDPRVQSAWDSLTPVARDRITSKVRDDANFQLAMASRTQTDGERNARVQAENAVKDFEDAMRGGQPEQQATALANVRRFGTAQQYAAAADQFYGVPANPRAASAEAFLQSRLDDRGNPLTIPELNDLRATRRINDQQYTAYSQRITSRDDRGFQDAQAFIRNALGAPGPEVGDNVLSAAQRQARDNANSTINRLMLERARIPGLNMLEWAQREVGQTVPPERSVQIRQAEASIARLPPTLRSRDAIEDLQQQLAARRAYENLPWLTRQTTAAPPMPTAQGQPVTEQTLSRWLGWFDTIEQGQQRR
ncbi:MAG: hypothetical protein RJA36_3731 [Pseudomonadota bacterium]|jgi:hypothetical protein